MQWGKFISMNKYIKIYSFLITFLFIIFVSCILKDRIPINNNDTYNQYSVNGNFILKDNIVLKIKAVVYVTGYPGIVPWDLEYQPTGSLSEYVKQRIYQDLSDIKDMGANTVRFWGVPKYCYEVIKDLKTMNILQTIWFDVSVSDYQDATYKTQCKAYMEMVVDRIYSAYSDNNPPIAAFLVGNELSESGISNTDSSHPEIDHYTGKYIKISNITASEAFLAEMADHLKDCEFTNYGKISLVSYSNEIRTYDIIDTPFLDFRSHNAYSYAVPYYITDPTSGSSTGTHFQGWVEYVKSLYPNKPLLITETGLSVSPNAAHIGPPDYGYGGNTEVEQSTGIYQNLVDINSSNLPIAGVSIHEYLDSWWKFSQEDSLTHDHDDVEEWFGIVELTEDQPGIYNTIFRPAYLAIKDYWK